MSVFFIIRQKGSVVGQEADERAPGASYNIRVMNGEAADVAKHTQQIDGAQPPHDTHTTILEIIQDTILLSSRLKAFLVSRKSSWLEKTGSVPLHHPSRTWRVLQCEPGGCCCQVGSRQPEERCSNLLQDGLLKGQGPLYGKTIYHITYRYFRYSFSPALLSFLCLYHFKFKAIIADSTICYF